MKKTILCVVVCVVTAFSAEAKLIPGEYLVQLKKVSVVHGKANGTDVATEAAMTAAATAARQIAMKLGGG